MVKNEYTQQEEHHGGSENRESEKLVVKIISMFHIRY